MLCGGMPTLLPPWQVYDAAREGETAEVRRLLAGGAHPNYKDMVTPLGGGRRAVSVVLVGTRIDVEKKCRAEWGRPRPPCVIVGFTMSTCHHLATRPQPSYMYVAYV